MTISLVCPGLWVGAMPEPGQDLSRFGAGLCIYVMRNDADKPVYEGAEVVHVPLVDNVADDVTVPPTVRGATLPELHGIAREIGDRVFDKKLPTIVCCEWGYNRSPFMVAWALVLRKRNPTAVMAGLNAARGPHPMGYGLVLNNKSFRAIVTGAGPVMPAAAAPQTAPGAVKPAEPSPPPPPPVAVAAPPEVSPDAPGV